MSDIECDGALTIVEVRDCSQDVAVGVECLWPADLTGGVSARVQDDFGVDEVAGGNSLVQSLAKSNGSRHVCRLVERVSFIIGRIYTMQKVRLFQAKPLKQAEDDRNSYDLGRGDM